VRQAKILVPVLILATLLLVSFSLPSLCFGEKASQTPGSKDEINAGESPEGRDAPAEGDEGEGTPF
jgi:hypothetical protein